MFIVFERASQERPQKLSLTADEIKLRGQPFTDTDLEEAKQRGICLVQSLNIDYWYHDH